MKCHQRSLRTVNVGETNPSIQHSLYWCAAPYTIESVGSGAVSVPTHNGPSGVPRRGTPLVLPHAGRTTSGRAARDTAGRGASGRSHSSGFSVGNTLVHTLLAKVLRIVKKEGQ